MHLRSPFLLTWNRFVYQVVAPKAYIPKALVEVYESGEKIVLPPWDPMVCFSIFLVASQFTYFNQGTLA